jgi:hypothetical protein
MKRNLINEITAIRSRSEFNSRHDFSSRLDDIEYAFKENLYYNGDFDKELIKYIPIATVACFEAFFRSVYKELIDFGKPFSDNVAKFNQAKNIKFDFEIINAIQTKVVTVGEFVSHILPCSNYDDININLSTLADINFTEQIRKFKNENNFDNPNDNSSNFIENNDQIIADIKRTFELRHIFCHEFATNIEIDKDEILRCFMNSKIFLNQTNDFIWDLLYPNAPKTQTDMNIQASETYLSKETELSILIENIKESTKDHAYKTLDNQKFDDVIAEWKKYRTAKASFDALSYEGGTMYSLIYSGSLITTTMEKIESLKKEYEIDLRRNNSR